MNSTTAAGARFDDRDNSSQTLRTKSGPRTSVRRLFRPDIRPWLIPVLYSLGAITAGFTIPRLTSILLPRLVSAMSVGPAIGIYSAIASGMIALTGIVFSLAFVMVQFSATAYSPRLVLWIARDPAVSHALGIFTATFFYALTALAWVDREARPEFNLAACGSWWCCCLQAWPCSSASFIALACSRSTECWSLPVIKGGRSLLSFAAPWQSPPGNWGLSRQRRQSSRVDSISELGVIFFSWLSMKFVSMVPTAYRLCGV